ncbi:MAG: hypothetical protein ABIR91_02600, partial [Candidatus Saccharimonadales bacterium]
QAKTQDVVAPTDIPGSSPTYDIPVKYTENTPEPVSLRAGAGGEQLMKSIGKDPHDWYAVADTVAQKFPDYFYTTTLDDVTIDTRIARKGAVPEPIIAYLQKHTK